jgi:hypothetical protein
MAFGWKGRKKTSKVDVVPKEFGETGFRPWINDRASGLCGNINIKWLLWKGP